MLKFKLLLTSAAIALASIFGAANAEYPDRPIEFVVPWPPGDLEDTITRMIAKRAQDEFGVPTSVVNIAGAGGLIGATHVANADPDGYTIGALPPISFLPTSSRAMPNTAATILNRWAS